MYALHPLTTADLAQNRASMDGVRVGKTSDGHHPQVLLGHSDPLRLEIEGEVKRSRLVRSPRSEVRLRTRYRRLKFDERVTMRIYEYHPGETRIIIGKYSAQSTRRRSHQEYPSMGQDRVRHIRH